MTLAFKCQERFNRLNKKSLKSKWFLNIISNLSRTQHDAFNTISRMHFNHLYVSMSQSTLAKWLGVTREWVNKCLRVLRELGLITSQKRNWMTNLYGLPACFNSPKIMQALGFWFSSFREAYDKQFTLLNLRFTKRSCKKKLVSLYGDTDMEFQKMSVLMSQVEPKKEEPPQKQEVDYRMFEKSTQTGKSNPVSSAILSLKALNLTKWGQLKLCAFPDEAINSAKLMITEAIASKDPFGYFYRLCVDYCLIHRISPDLAEAQRLMKEYKAPAEPNMILRQIVNLPDTLPFEGKSSKLTDSEPVATPPCEHQCSLKQVQMDEDEMRREFPKITRESLSMPMLDTHSGVRGVTATRRWYEDDNSLTQDEKVAEIQSLSDASEMDTPGNRFLASCGSETKYLWMKRIAETIMER